MGRELIWTNCRNQLIEIYFFSIIIENTTLLKLKFKLSGRKWNDFSFKFKAAVDLV
jgi:hypothetical protein